jgi:hypothetical protein
MADDGAESEYSLLILAALNGERQLCLQREARQLCSGCSTLWLNCSKEAADLVVMLPEQACRDEGERSERRGCNQNDGPRKQ